VHQTVGSLMERFKKEMVGGSAPDSSPSGYVNGSYNAAILKNGIVSVLLDYDEYTPGAVHPWGVMASINYDSRTCRVLALSDLFRPGVYYLSRLSQLAIASLDQNEFADHYAIRHGAGPVESNFKVFTLTDTGVALPHVSGGGRCRGATKSCHPAGQACAATSGTMILCERTTRGALQFPWLKNCVPGNSSCLVAGRFAPQTAIHSFKAEVVEPSGHLAYAFKHTHATRTVWCQGEAVSPLSLSRGNLRFSGNVGR
jgi:hypothetical protein